MGARTNFVIKTTPNPDENIVLYSHWGGDESETAFAYAINKAMPRIQMGDTSYATRIIVSQLIGSDWDSETGFGLYVGEISHEEQYQYKEIDLVDNTVTIGDHTTSIQAFLDYQLGVPA
jgi:hypothetical protein